METALIVGVIAVLIFAIYEIQKLKKELKYTDDKLNELFKAYNKKRIF